MLDKYFFLMILIAANTIGKDIDNFNINYISTPLEYEFGEFKKTKKDSVSLIMAKETARQWKIGYAEGTNTLEEFEITDSRIIFYIKKERVVLDYNWVAFKNYNLKDRDTLFTVEEKSPVMEVIHDKREKTMEIGILNPEKIKEVSKISISYN